MSTSKLFIPTQVGASALAHRVVLAPLTRLRANSAHGHGELAVEYYGQRAAVPGTLLITEATFIAQKAGGHANVPGIWNQDQVQAWKKVTDAVHARGSYIYLQLWALGRAADPAVLEAEDASLPFVSASATQIAGSPRATRALTVAEIAEYVQLYATAAANAVHGAAFDGVEVHGANGYLIDQFTQDVSNFRTDAYGGSVENRARFALEVVDAVVKAVGAERTGIRLSPWSKFNDVGMANPVPTFSHIVTEIKARHPDFAYVHVVQPRIHGNFDEKDGGTNPSAVHASNDFIRDIWAPKRLIVAGGFKGQSAKAHAERYDDLVAFGRYFISNPDLPTRIEKDIEFTPYERSKFYINESPVGYVDYPTADASAKL